jgi:predicted 3-demethylubiquinone-9 3-methyltransferase (glyoxalase superfamily)
MSKVRTCLWFDGNGAAAAQFYVSLLPNSVIETEYPAGTEPLMVNFRLDGVPYVALNGGAHYALTPAASIMVMTKDQAETDRIWDALVTGGGTESRCAWCVDRFGVSWQVVPEALPRTVGGPDPEGAARATKAMMGMTKIDIAALERAYAGED